MAGWRESLKPDVPDPTGLKRAFDRWDQLRGGKTRNTEIVWFPKPNTSLTDIREKLKVALEAQLQNQATHSAAYFAEDRVAEELIKRGAMTRPGTAAEEIMEEYDAEATANKPHISSFRMTNRVLRFLGWTTRRVGSDNQYVVTRRGQQLSEFAGPFPGQIGRISEKELVVQSLLDASVFSVNDHIEQWDTRFAQRIVVSLLACAERHGIITNNELVVSSFALKDERDPRQVKEMFLRLEALWKGSLSMAEAFAQVGVDPLDSSAVNNAYDGPKVLTSLCRQSGLLLPKSMAIRDAPVRGAEKVYARMHRGRSSIKVPRVVNVISEEGRKRLADEQKKLFLRFDDLR